MYLIEMYQYEIEHWTERLAHAKSVEQYNLYLKQLNYWKNQLAKVKLEEES